MDLPIYLSIYLSIHPSIYLSIYLYIYILYIIYIYIYIYIYNVCWKAHHQFAWVFSSRRYALLSPTRATSRTPTPSLSPTRALKAMRALRAMQWSRLMMIGKLRINSRSRNHVFHRTTCRYVQGEPRNGYFIHLDQEAALERGYRPCFVCFPHTMQSHGKQGEVAKSHP